MVGSSLNEGGHRIAEARGVSAIVDEFLTRHEEALVQLADGCAPLGGREVNWRTAGVYRVADARIAEAWLVPLDQEHFDRVWAASWRMPVLVRGGGVTHI
jgi:hypothetical protein